MDQDGNDYEKLKCLQAEIVERRTLFKERAELQFYEQISTIEKLISETNYDQARHLAYKLFDTVIFGKIVTLFEQTPETFQCVKCSSVISGLFFNKTTLRWIRPQLCERCENREIECRRETQQKQFVNYVKKNIDSILIKIGIDKLLLPASYEGYSKTEIETCKRSVSGKHGLFICGDSGRGKSWLAVAVLKDLIEKCASSQKIVGQNYKNVEGLLSSYRFVYVPLQLIEIRANYGNKNYSGELNVVQELTKIPVLILDDIGVEKLSEWVREKLNTIIHFRNSRALKTIYTSNVLPDQIAIQFGNRIASRIHQDCEIIHLKGPDRRQYS